MTEPRALPLASDADARRRAIQANGSVLVQAPAGSGKTTLLVQRYLRLLSLVDAPERILALTFTRRAAGEMRERVLEALRVAQADDRPPAMNPQTWELAAAARHHLDTLNLDIERQPSRLRIETIDAFNSWLAGQLPISAGAGSGLRVQADAGPNYEEAARRALAYQEQDRFGAAVDRVLALDDQRWRKLVSLIAAMLPSRDRWLPLLAGAMQAASALDDARLVRVREQFDQDLQLLVTRALNRAHDTFGQELLDALAPLMHRAAQRLSAERADKILPEMLEWTLRSAPLRAEAADLARWRAFAKLCLTGERKIRRSLTKNEGFAPQSQDKSAMLDLLQELDRHPAARRTLIEIQSLPPPRYSDEQWARVREVAQVLVLSAAELDQVWRDAGTVDFPAVSLAALRALGSSAAPTDLGLRLDYRLQHILVDEFQDTSSAQLELVRLLTAGWQRGDGRSVFCVGDPMQSIYGFRQAEVRAFLELAEEGIGDVRFEVLRLSDNFRSAKPVVDWINESFSAILPRVDDRERGAIAFRASVAAAKAAASDSVQPMRAPGVETRGFASRAEESAYIAGEIGSALAEHPDWRIVVLVRARAHARDIAAGLRARGIEFRAVDIEPLQDRAIVRDIIMLTAALLHFGDRTAWLAVLRAPWAGICLADLLLISRGAPLVWEAMADDAVMARLSEDGRVRCRRLHGLLQAAFLVRNDSSLARWVETTWLAIGGPSTASGAEDLQLVSAAFARLRDLEARGLPDAADLFTGFADLYADHGAAGRVEIMTIHKAKGLEFDLVVVPALDRFVPQSRDQLLLTHQFARTGRDGMVMAARPPTVAASDKPGAASDRPGAASDRLYEFLRHQLRDAAALEAERLLYVACTRAKWQLRLTATVGQSPARDETAAAGAPAGGQRDSFTPRAGSLLAVLWPVARAGFAVAESPAAPPTADVEAPRGGQLTRMPLHWLSEARSPQDLWTDAGLGAAAAQSPAAPPQSGDQPGDEAREETPVFDWAGETARRVGSLVHAELQRMQLASSDEPSIRARAPHFRRWLALHGVPAERLEEAAARVVTALLQVRADPRGRWILQPAREDFREHALSGEWQGEVARIVIDRSFIDEHGVRWVIDYKTSQHLGGGLEEFLDREVERYRPQLNRYAAFAKRLGPEPVRLGLYFPLMRAWREWPA
jgi:ATP-dependent exoDNAse (exonuclease V) beta subunit